MEEKQLENVNFIKLDVQGAEIDVLRGAENTLKNVRFILLEASIVQYNQGSPLIDEVVSYMSSIGSKIFDIIDYHYQKERLIQIDVLFVKT